MKLIIDIPEEIVTAIQNGQDYRYDIHTAIAQGKPCDTSDDLISREWLKDAFDNLCCHNCKICRNFRNEDSFYKCALIENAPTIKTFTLADIEDQYRKGLEKGLSEWETERPQGEWTPVSEGLPEFTGLYLISVDDVVTVANFTGTYFMDRGGGRVKVYAWQPLPEPYQKGGAE